MQRDRKAAVLFMAGEALQMKIKLNLNDVVITGLAIGIAAAAAQAFFGVQHPEAYGVCLIGHPSVLVKWLSNNLFNTHFPIGTSFVVYPSLLVVGILGGALISAIKSGELKNGLISKPLATRRKYMAVLFGFLVANFGLIVGACPIRTALLVGYGSVLGVIMLFSIIGGVFLATLYMRRS
jgi:hypothetical protein